MRSKRKELEELRVSLGVAMGLLKIREDALVAERAMRAGTKDELDRTKTLVEIKDSEILGLASDVLAANAEKHALEVKNAVLTERLDLVANHGIGEPSRLTGPTAMPEEAEDALFAFRAGHIDKTSLEQALAQSGYDNTEIEFELSEYPHFAAKQ